MSTKSLIKISKQKQDWLAKASIKQARKKIEGIKLFVMSDLFYFMQAIYNHRFILYDILWA